MSNSVDYSVVYGDVEAFVYRPEQPTYWTELLSHRTLKMSYLIGQAGGKVLVETATPEAQQEACDTYMSAFSTWLSDTSDAVTAWLLSSEKSRALPAIIAAPALPAIIAGAIVLYRGMLIKMGVETVSTIIRTASRVQAARRDTQVVRLLDKSLMRSSWFGIEQSPYLSEVVDALQSLTDQVNVMQQHLEGSNMDGEVFGLADMLYHLMAKQNYDGSGSWITAETIAEIQSKLADKPALIKLLVQAIISSGGNIDMIDFDVADSL